MRRHHFVAISSGALLVPRALDVAAAGAKPRLQMPPASVARLSVDLG